LGSYGWIRYPKDVVVLENPLAIFGLGELFFCRCISCIPQSLRHVRWIRYPQNTLSVLFHVHVFFSSRSVSGGFLIFYSSQSLPLPHPPTTKPPFRSPHTSTQNNHLTLPSPYTCLLIHPPISHLPHPTSHLPSTPSHLTSVAIPSPNPQTSPLCPNLRLHTPPVNFSNKIAYSLNIQVLLYRVFRYCPPTLPSFMLQYIQYIHPLPLPPRHFHSLNQSPYFNKPSRTHNLCPHDDLSRPNPFPPHEPQPSRTTTNNHPEPQPS